MSTSNLVNLDRKRVRVQQDLHEALVYEAFSSHESVERLIDQAVFELLERRGLVAGPDARRECHLCGSKLNVRTVAHDLYKRGIWECRECRKHINRKLEIGRAERRREREEQERAPVRRLEQRGVIAR